MADDESDGMVAMFDFAMSGLTRQDVEGLDAAQVREAVEARRLRWTSTTPEVEMIAASEITNRVEIRFSSGAADEAGAHGRVR